MIACQSQEGLARPRC